MNILKHNVEKKVLIKYFALIVLLISLVSFAFYLIYKGSSDSSQNTTQVLSTSLSVKAIDLDPGTPLTLVNLENNQIQTILAGEKIKLGTGRYKVSYNSDDRGSRSKEVILNANQELEINLDEQKEFKSTGKSSAKKLNLGDNSDKYLNFSRIQESADLANFKPVSDVRVEQSNKIAEIVYPNNSTTLKSDQSNSTAAITIPTTDNINSLTKNLVVKNNEELRYIEKDCTIVDLNFSSDAKNLRYFRDCPGNQIDGIVNYSLESKSSIVLVKTSNYENKANVTVHPKQNEAVIVNPQTGDLSLSLNGENPILLKKEAFYRAPGFSPDGKYVLFAKTPSNINTKATELQELFKQEIYKVNYEDLKKNSSKAKFESIGETFYVPRGFELNYEYYRFQNEEKFYAGDSQNLFSLNQNSAQKSQEAEPGHYYTASDGQKWRIYQYQLFNQSNQKIADRVTGVYQLQDGQTWFLIDGFLSRIVDDQIVVAYSKPIVSAKLITEGLEVVGVDGTSVKLVF